MRDEMGPALRPPCPAREGKAAGHARRKKQSRRNFSLGEKEGRRNPHLDSLKGEGRGGRKGIPMRKGGTAINNSCAEERTGSKRRSELRHHKRHSWRPADGRAGGAHTSEQPLIARAVHSGQIKKRGSFAARVRVAKSADCRQMTAETPPLRQ